MKTKKSLKSFKMKYRFSEQFIYEMFVKLILNIIENHKKYQYTYFLIFNCISFKFF